MDYDLPNYHLGNLILILSAASWATAQVLKVVIQLVTTLRQNPLKGLISKESPVGKAVLGHKIGDRVKVEVNADYSYYVEIRAIEKGQDDDSMEISRY